MLKIRKFEADWCGPCQTQSTIFADEVYPEWEDNDDIRFETIDIDEQQEEANKYNVRSLPTTVIESVENQEDDITEPDTEIIERFVGVADADELNDVLSDNA